MKTDRSISAQTQDLNADKRESDQQCGERCEQLIFYGADQAEEDGNASDRGDGAGDAANGGTCKHIQHTVEGGEDHIQNNAEHFGEGASRAVGADHAGTVAGLQLGVFTEIYVIHNCPPEILQKSVRSKSGMETAGFWVFNCPFYCLLSSIGTLRCHYNTRIDICQ